jgi:hypothetical protein
MDCEVPGLAAEEIVGGTDGMVGHPCHEEAGEEDSLAWLALDDAVARAARYC